MNSKYDNPEGVFLFNSNKYKEKMKNKNIELDSNQQNLKNYGLGYCITTLNKDKNSITTNDIDIAIGGYFNLMTYDYDVTRKVIHYILKNAKRISSISKHTGSPINFMRCMEIYNSKEFDLFILEQDNCFIKDKSCINK